jgi:hypothetical protein
VIDNTLEISITVLDTLRRASQLAPVPFLQMAASIALSIVQQAQVCFYQIISSCSPILNYMQDTRGTKDDFQRLAKDACDLVYVALVAREARENEGREASSDLDSNLEDLVK